MLDISNAKSMARTLRTSLSERCIDLPHSACLELVARQFGFSDWNVLSARLEELEAPRTTPLTLPKDWFVVGSVSDKTHRFGLDPDQPGAALIESIVARGQGKDLTGGIAVMMQSIGAQDFLGQRLRLTAELKAEDADDATLWMRVDGYERRGLSFDNMMERQTDGPLKGTTNWTRRSIVLDVSELAASLHYGFFLKGYGRAWARNVRIEAVGNEIPVTMIRLGETGDVSRMPRRPANLNFCER
ncbi:glyoxalase superfamily protein [Methylorubrum extorquens]